ncbi:MAG TPA: hypothetical protein PLN33_08030 [Hyphomonadaceae bacterium]|nr:hypothetical protein [Hyphomonadaceae bacterium]
MPPPVEDWGRWIAWREPGETEGVRDAVGLPLLGKWDADHADDIVYAGGPLDPTRRATPEGVTTVVNELTVFMVVRAASLQAAAELVKDHPHITHFPCDAAEVKPVLGL